MRNYPRFRSEEIAELAQEVRRLKYEIQILRNEKENLELQLATEKQRNYSNSPDGQAMLSRAFLGAQLIAPRL